MRRTGTERIGILVGLAALFLAVPALAQYREYYVRGRVVDAKQQAIAEVEIEARDVATSRSYHLKSAKDGTFKLAGLPHGTYRVSFTREGFAPKQDDWKLEAPQDTMQRVDLPDVVLVSREQIEAARRSEDAKSTLEDAAEKIRKRDFDQAIPQLEYLVHDHPENVPENVNALYFLGLGYAGKQRYREAIDVLKRVTDLKPTSAGAYFELGVCHQGLREAPAALAYFEKSLELDASNADAAYNAGLILFEMNRIADALSRFEQGLASKPEDPELLEMVGRCYIHQEKLDLAVASLEKARAATTDRAKTAFLDELIAKLRTQMK